MSTSFEQQMWAMAHSAYGEDLRKKLEVIISVYRRRPGLTDFVRIHERAVGHGSYASLVSALASTLPRSFHQHSDCVEIRVPLRWHIIRHLQRAMIEDGHATS